MWLNEGFTVFEERKITASLAKKEDRDDVFKVAAYLGNVSLVYDLQIFGFESNYSSLHPEIGDAFPDDSYSRVPYEKGFQLLYYIES